MSPESPTTDPQSTPSPAPRKFSIRPALIIVAITASVQAALWWWLSGDSSKQVLSSWVMFPLTALLLVLWWLFFSALRWKTRLTGIALLAVVVGAFFAAFRFKGFTGDFIPQYEARWSATPEERLAQFLSDQKSGGVHGETAAQTIEITKADWPQFGGPQRDGIARGERVRSDWSKNPPKQLWKHPVGLGWSSFSIVDRFAFTQEQRGEEEVVVCYNSDTGEQIWAHSDTTRFVSAMGGDGPRATPTLHDGRLYALGATGILNCLEPSTGKKIWSRNILEDAKVGNAGYGMCASPLVFDDLIVVCPGGKKNSAVAAYNRVSGEPVWAAGSHDAGYASPILAEIGGARHILVYDADGLGGYDPKDGHEMWHFEWVNDTRNNIVQPIVREDGTIFISSGYSKGSALLELNRAEENWTVKSRWETPNQFKLKFNGGVYRDGYVYGLDEGILSCYDAAQGKRMWRKGRYRYGQVILLNDLLLVTTDTGEVVLVEISPESANEIARFQAIEGKTWNHPVVNRGRLYIRSEQEAACYDIALPEVATTK